MINVQLPKHFQCMQLRKICDIRIQNIINFVSTLHLQRVDIYTLRSIDYYFKIQTTYSGNGWCASRDTATTLRPPTNCACLQLTNNRLHGRSTLEVCRQQQLYIFIQHNMVAITKPMQTNTKYN